MLKMGLRELNNTTKGKKTCGLDIFSCFFFFFFDFTCFVVIKNILNKLLNVFDE